jgi:hypothetical protein
MFDESGRLKPEFTESYEKSIAGAFAELLWFARALKAARAAV